MDQSRNKTNKTENDVKRAVVAMLSLKLRSGSTPEELKTFVSQCMREALKAHAPSTSQGIVFLYQIARLLRTWYLETRFLKKSGVPRPLKMGGKNGLRALVMCHFPERSVETVLSTMKRNGLLRRRESGYWVPTSRYARTPKPTAELLSHFAEGVSRLAETVTRNTSAKGAGKKLLERAAQVDDLPISQVPAFRKYVHAQGMAYLTAVDDWLETRSSKTTGFKGPVCQAGAFTFAFIDEPGAGDGELANFR